MLADSRRLVSSADGSFLALLAVATAAAAGVLHLVVSPMHFAEATGQGIFFVFLGVVQLLWSVLYLRKANLALFLAGLAIPIASILVWLVAIEVRPPFQAGAEVPEPIAYATKAVEALTVLALLAIPFVHGKRAQTPLPSAIPALALAIVLGIAGGGVAYGAGLVGEVVAPELGQGDGAADGDMAMTPASAHTAGTDAHAGMTHSSGAGTTPATNASSNQTYNYSNCMVGMDMPGCPASVAEARYREQQKNQPPPDRPLAPANIILNAQGTGETSKFEIPDNGTMRLLVKVTLSDTGSAGPWAAAGPGGMGDLKVELKGPSSATPDDTITIAGSANSAGVSPASSLKRGPYESVVSMPALGGWTITVDGQGTNVQVTVELTESFVM